ncbi:hypothetical protein [Pseudonocardia kunmingensis]|uniref:t-SNARE coiled-coil homology domain-containing protein n=1 Tax=Pseudonocardia kunmingensis TaxID=630975 RepID=A0A543D172_9PSEU|nr:hypothetical protein [Pseudonocardia kunmingensis]TQM03103.1 hypothetical protein FB558_7752 [Pseudonocardia kunmingensis]
MPDEDDAERRLRKLALQHAETRWLALRLDNDAKEIRGTQREHTRRFDGIDRRLDGIDGRLDGIDGRLEGIDGRLDRVDRELQEHGGRFDSLETSMRSLTQMVGQVLERLPESPDKH